MRWYYGWNVLAVALLFQAVTFGIGLYSFTFWVNPWVQEFGASRGSVLFAITIASLGSGVLSPFIGGALDRLSIRGLVCAGAVTFSLGLVLLSQATAAWQIAGVYGTLMAAGLVLAGPMAGQTLAAKWFRGRRGLAIGLVSVGTSIGGFLFPPLVTELLAGFGWREAHLILAGVVLVVIVPPAWLVIRNGPAEHGVDPEPENDQSEALTARFAGRIWSTRAILSERAFWITMIAFVGPSTAFGGIQQNLGPYAEDLGFAPQRASFLMSLIAATMIGGKIFFGSFADRWDNRYLYWLAVSALVVAMLLMHGTPSYQLMLLISVLLGISAGGFLPLMGAIISSRFGPQSFGKVMGLLVPFLTLSSVGPAFAGWIRDSAGSYDAALLVFLVGLVPPALAMVLLPRAEGVVDDSAAIEGAAGRYMGQEGRKRP